MNIAIKLPDDPNERVLTFPFLHQVYETLKDEDNLNFHLISKEDEIELLHLLPFQAYYHPLSAEDLKNVFNIHRASMTLKIYQLDFFIDLSGNLVDAMIGFWLKAENRLGFQKTLNSFFYSDNFIKLKGRHPLDSYEELGQIAFENFEEAKRVEPREFERLVEGDYFIIEFKEESFECWKDFFDLVENKKFLLWCPGNIEAISLEKLNNKNQYTIIEKDWIQLAKYLTYCDTFITSDILLLNIASYLGVYSFYLNRKEHRMDLMGPRKVVGSYLEFKNENVTALMDDFHRFIERERF